MSHHPVPPPPSGAWRLLIADPDRSDPKVILATVASPGDVGGADGPLIEAAAWWAAARTGGPVTLTEMPGVRVWLVEQGPRP